MTKAAGGTSSGRSEHAIARVRGSATSSIKQTRANAKRINDTAVVEACKAELRIRGSVDLMDHLVKRMQDVAARMKGKPLAEVIEHAFTEVPPSRDEGIILRWVASSPGPLMQNL